MIRTLLPKCTFIRHCAPIRRESIRDKLKQAGGTQGYRNVATGKKKLQPFVSIHELAKLDQDLSGNYLLVATLIATVAFTAGITIPGGYYGADSPNKGMAVLGKKAAFIVFVISDSSALMLSMGAVIAQIVEVEGIFHRAKFNEMGRLWAYGLPMITLIRMAVFGASMSLTIAFVSGLFVVIQSFILKIWLCLPAAYICFQLTVSFFWLIKYTKSEL